MSSNGQTSAVDKHAERAMQHLALGHELRRAATVGNRSGGPWLAMQPSTAHGGAKMVAVDGRVIMEEAIIKLMEEGFISYQASRTHPANRTLQLTAKGRAHTAVQTSLGI